MKNRLLVKGIETEVSVSTVILVPSFLEHLQCNLRLIMRFWLLGVMLSAVTWTSPGLSLHYPYYVCKDNLHAEPLSEPPPPSPFAGRVRGCRDPRLMSFGTLSNPLSKPSHHSLGSHRWAMYKNYIEYIAALSHNTTQSPGVFSPLLLKSHYYSWNACMFILGKVKCISTIYQA